MSRIRSLAFMFFATFSTSAVCATAAETVETAISDWVAAIDAASEWSAGFADISYDEASDTAFVSGLTIAYTAAGLTLSFEPITIAGFAEAADGTFGANTIATDGATVTGEDFDASLSDIRYEGIDGLNGDFDELAAWDPRRPFTSMMRAYAHFLDIRLAHAEIGSMSMTAENHGEQLLFSYEDVALEGWGDGKIESVTTGPLTMAAAGGAEPFSMTVAGTEARGIDYAAFMRIYNPDQYAGGVGDGIWRNAAEFVGYDTLVFDTREAKLTFGALSVEDFRVRQPERSFNEFFDRAMLTPNAQVAPTSEEARAILGYLSSFAVGSTSLTDVDVEAEDGGTGHLGEVRLIDASIEGLGEFSLHDVSVSPPGRGKVDIGRIAVGGIVFPSLEALVEAAKAEEAGEKFDYAKLATELAFFEASAIDVDVPEGPHVTLGKARLDLGNYIGAIPTLLALEIVDADLPVDAIEEPKARALWQALGYERIRGNFGGRLAWNGTAKTVAIDGLRFSIDGVATLSLSAVLDGLSREALGNLEGLPEELGGLNLVRGRLSLEDYAVLDRWIDQQAAMTGNQPEALRQHFATMLAEITSGVGDVGFQEQLQRVVEASVMAPGSITATAAPSGPVPLEVLLAVSQMAPASLPDLLGLTIETTSTIP